jgi:BirA family biotin operon repressor/biotin-[acetyl-CoA-carboxylase] ligase
LVSQNSIGHVIIELTEIDSTNNYATRLIEEGMAEHGMTIRADYQLAGKGQLGNTWHADESKNLLFTVILDMTAFDISQQFLLNKSVCISIVELLTETYMLNNVKIKWPNDIYAGDKKIAGILIENILRGNDWKYAVVGIGLNVNQEKFQELNRATSILLESKKVQNIKQSLKHLTKKLQYNFLNIKKSPIELEDQFTRMLYKIGHKISFKKNHELYEGVVIGVSNDGMLMLEVNGKLKKYKHKEIELLLG